MALLINRNYTLWWVGQTICYIGDYLFDIAVILWIATILGRGQAWAPLAVSGVLLAANLPFFIIGPLAGVFVDRWPDKRRTMLRMDGLSALAVLLLLVFITTSHLAVFWQLGVIYCTVCLISICAQFSRPSSLALIDVLVDEKDYTRARSLMQVIFRLGMLIGPPIGALLFFAVGLQWVLLLNVLSFIASFLAVLIVKVSPLPLPESKAEETQEPQHILQEFLQGLRFFGRSKILLVVVGAGALEEFTLGALGTLNIFFLTRNLNTPANWYGLLDTCVGIGSILGAIGAGLFIQRIGLKRSYWLGVMLRGLFLLLYARMVTFAPALALLSGLGLLAGIEDVIGISLIMEGTPREFIGRVISVFGPIYGIATMLSTIVFGSLMSTIAGNFHLVIFYLPIGPIDTIFTALGLSLVLCGWLVMLALRKT